ncbi:UDP-N-acetyl-2-amino-2-deoxyglucuronate dehydrogenase [Bradyrhizobium sp. S3.12.5]|uniref:Gfo/Idh/MocA family protein n=1 Tax=Bradyrhizobium sp. S3.12.5 TaxID=3156386 RepID=UPI003391A7B4
MSQLRIGLVGPGAIGETHARAIRALDETVLAAVAGGTPEQIAACIDGAPVPAFATTDAMLAGADIDAVVVCTPSGAHHDAALAAIRSGRHVLVEKPLCVDPAEAASLVRAAESSQLTCGVVSQRRLEPQHLAIKKLLDAGSLGQPRLIEAAIHWYRSDAYYAEKPWRAEADHGGGSLFNQGVHNLDLMLWLFGPVASVQGKTATLGHVHAIEDTTAALLSFASGPLGVIVTSTALPPGRPAMLRLFTDRGSCELAHDRIVCWDFPDIPQPASATGPGSAANDPKAIGIEGHIAQWRDFVQAVRERRAPATPFRDGFEATRVVTAIYRSAAEGRAVTPNDVLPEMALDAR